MGGVRTFVLTKMTLDSFNRKHKGRGSFTLFACSVAGVRAAPSVSAVTLVCHRALWPGEGAACVKAGVVEGGSLERTKDTPLTPGPQKPQGCLSASCQELGTKTKNIFLVISQYHGGQRLIDQERTWLLYINYHSAWHLVGLQKQ